MSARTLVPDEARLRFVEAPIGEGLPTLKDIAAEFGFPYGTIRNIASVQGWTKQREKFVAERERARQLALMQEQADAIVDFDDQTIRIARAALGRLAQFLTEDGQVVGRDFQGQPISRANLRPGDMLNIANTMAQLQNVIYRAAGSEAEDSPNMPLGAPGNIVMDWESLVREAREAVGKRVEQRRQIEGTAEPVASAND